VQRLCVEPWSIGSVHVSGRAPRDRHRHRRGRRRLSVVRLGGSASRIARSCEEGAPDSRRSKQNRRDSESSASRRFCFAERSWGRESALPGGGRVRIRPAGKKGYGWIGVSPIRP
jgi:hypothetical protein